MVVAIIAILIVIFVIVNYPIVGAILGAIVALIIFLIYKSSKKAAKEAEDFKRLVENTLASHPEFGEYKLFIGASNTILMLSENGYYGYFLNSAFHFDKIQNAKGIKFITFPYDKKLRSTTSLAGEIKYRLEVNDFQNPLIDLPFGVYRDNADKTAKMSDFAEVKANFEQIKKRGAVYADGNINSVVIEDWNT